MGVVKLVKPEEVKKTDYGFDYFPRKIYYKKDAEKKVEEIFRLYGVRATAEKE